MLATADLEYELPAKCIARSPAEPRDSARLMHVPLDGTEPSHRTVRELPDLLQAGDLLVLNTSRVVPARVLGVREDTVEYRLLKARRHLKQLLGRFNDQDLH